MSNSVYIANITEHAWVTMKEVLEEMKPYLFTDKITDFGKEIYEDSRYMAYKGAEYASKYAQKGAETAADLAFDAADLASDVANEGVKMAKDMAKTGKDIVGGLGNTTRQLYSSMKEGFAKVGF